jgi:hypothetical protein
MKWLLRLWLLGVRGTIQQLNVKQPHLKPL